MDAAIDRFDRRAESELSPELLTCVPVGPLPAAQASLFVQKVAACHLTPKLLLGSVAATVLRVRHVFAHSVVVLAQHLHLPNARNVNARHP